MVNFDNVVELLKTPVFDEPKNLRIIFDHTFALY
jgi:hypothetical protein